MKLELIPSIAARRACFNRRMKGFAKGVTELSILCDVQVGAVIYSPFSKQFHALPGDAAPNEVLSKLQTTPENMKEVMTTQETYLQQQIEKLKEQQKKLCKDNRERELKQAMFECMSGKATMDGMNGDDLIDLVCLINRHLREVDRNLQDLMSSDQESEVNPLELLSDTAVRVSAAEAEAAANDGGSKGNRSKEIAAETGTPAGSSAPEIDEN